MVAISDRVGLDTTCKPNHPIYSTLKFKPRGQSRRISSAIGQYKDLIWGTAHFEFHGLFFRTICTNMCSGGGYTF